jgi:hypothetical protein
MILYSHVESDFFYSFLKDIVFLLDVFSRDCCQIRMCSLYEVHEMDA